MRHAKLAGVENKLDRQRAARLCRSMQFFLSVLLIVSGIARPVLADERAYERFLRLYDGMLSEHLHRAQRKGVEYVGVDYDAWSRDPRHARARQLLVRFDPGTLGGLPERLSFWINVYNFLTLDLIVKTGERETIRNLGGLFQTPWQKHEWRVGREQYTLDEIEHEILRPLGEPRIHFAINCAAISCPDLRSEAHRPDRLEMQLEDQLRRTLANPTKGMSGKPDGGVLYVSKIFDWFEEDFADGRVRHWLRERARVPVPADVALEYLPYDWSLNRLSR